MRRIAVICILFLVSSWAFAQNEHLMMKCHGKTPDYAKEIILQLIQENNGQSLTQEDLEDFEKQYSENTKAFLEEFDKVRHKQLLMSFQQAQNAKWQAIGSAFGGVVGIAQAISNDQQRVNAESKARAEAESAAREQARQESIRAYNQQNQQTATNTYGSIETRASQTSTGNNSNGSVKDLYTSDPTWNRTVDQLNQQYGPEKTRQMVNEMRAQQAQSSQANQTTQSTNKDGSIPGSTVLTAVTTNRTLVYIQINSGSITHYATGGKNQMGEYNWNYAGKVSIQNINMTSYASQFGKDYSHAANINGVGYVFFNY